MADLRNVEFFLMWQDKTVAHVVMQDGELVCNENFTDNMYENEIRNVKDGYNMREYLIERVLPPIRFDSEMQNYFGMKQWDAFELLKRTHGAKVADFAWIKFKGEELKWEDVKTR